MAVDSDKDRDEARTAVPDPDLCFPVSGPEPHTGGMDLRGERLDAGSAWLAAGGSVVRATPGAAETVTTTALGSGPRGVIVGDRIVTCR